MTDPRLTFHVGLHKTGSTYFQQAVFPHWPELGYVGRPLRRDTIRAMVESGASSVLFSSESLAGSLIDAYRDPHRDWLARQCRQIRRLGALFSGAGVMIGFRGHADWLLSIYKHYLKYGGTRGLEAFIDPERDKGLLRCRDLHLEPRLASCREAFGERVFPFLWEELRDDPARLFGDMARFLGVAQTHWQRTTGQRLNEGVDRRQAAILQRLNRLTGGLACPDPLRSLRFALARGLGSLGGSAPALALPPALAAWVREDLADDWQQLTGTIRHLRAADGGGAA